MQMSHNELLSRLQISVFKLGVGQYQGIGIELSIGHVCSNCQSGNILTYFINLILN